MAETATMSRQDIIAQDRAREVKKGTKCRVRTAAEMEAIFGEDWKEAVEFEWNFDGEMDYLFGQTFTVKDVDRGGCSGRSYNSREGIERGWTISKDMLEVVEA